MSITQTTQDKPLADIVIERIITFIRNKREQDKKNETIQQDTRSEKARQIEVLLPSFECHKEQVAIAELVSVLLGEKVKVISKQKDYSIGKVFLNGSNGICLALTRDNHPIGITGRQTFFTETFNEATDEQFESFIKDCQWQEAFRKGSLTPLLPLI